MKCDQCQDGYLIVKPGDKGYFLGCTNYKPDGSGCNNAISRDKYFEITSLTPDKPIVSVKKKRGSDPDKNVEITVNENYAYDKKEYNLNNYTDFYVVSKIIIKCVENIAQKKYLGIKKIVSILFGIEPENSSKMNLKQLPEFGVLEKCDERQVEIAIYALIKQNLLLKTKEQYPVLHPTNEGNGYCLKYDKDLVTKTFRTYLGMKKYYQKVDEQSEN